MGITTLSNNITLCCLKVMGSGIGLVLSLLLIFDFSVLSHAMNDLVNYDPGSRKIPPESGSVTAMSDFASDGDSESGGPSLPMGVHSDMPDFDDIDSTLQMTECVGFGDRGGLVCLERFPGVRKSDGGVGFRQ